ncbi:unnamed protein product [Closterium sp. NIES-53]
MATPSVLTFDTEGCAVDFEVWVDDLQLFLQCDRADGLSLFDLTSGASPAPPATADSTVRSQWATRNAAARLAVRRHLPTTERAHFSQYRSAQTLYDAVVARYSSPATAALSRLILPYLFPDLAAFPTVADLITHLRICPTTLTVDLLEQRLLAAETSIVAVGASRGDPRTPVFEGCSPSPLLPSVASAATADLGGFESVGAASAPSGRCRLGRSKGGKGTGGTGGGGRGGGGGSGGGWGGGGRGGGGGGVGSSSGGGGGGEGSGGGGGGGGGRGGGGGGGGGGSSGAGRGSTQRSGSGGGQRQQQQRSRETPSPQQLREWYAPESRSSVSNPSRRPSGPVTYLAALALPFLDPTCRPAASSPTPRPSRRPLPAPLESAGTETTAGGLARGPPGAAGGSGATGGAAGEGAPGGGTGAVPVVSGVAARPRPYFVPLLEQVLGSPPSTGLPSSLACPQPVQSLLQLQPTSPLPAPSPYTGPTGGLSERREPASRPASPVRAARTSGRGSRQRPPPVPGTHRMSLRLSTAPLRVPLPSPPESSLPALADPESDSLRAASPTVTRLLATVVTDPSFESTAASALVTEVVDFAASCRLDYAASLVTESESVCPPSVGGECALGTDVFEDRQEEFQCLAAASPHLVSAAMDAEMASWKSTRTYVDAVPPPGANFVSGMWIFRVKRPPGSPPVFKARYMARGFSQRQGVDYFQTFSPTPKMTTLRVLLHVAAHRDYELHSLDFSTAFLQGSLHEEIWLRRPLGFTGTFLPGTQWSLRWPVYGLRQAPREWHDTLRTTLAALGFAPSTADPSLFLRTDTSLTPFYILVYVDDLVFATADTAGLAHVKSELQKRHTCTDLGELRSYLGLHITRDRARRTITLTQSHMV